MDEKDKQIFRLRLKLKNGEEFEAEGSLEFVNQQKNEFLKLSVSQKQQDNQNYGIKIVPQQQIGQAYTNQNENTAKSGYTETVQGENLPETSQPQTAAFYQNGQAQAPQTNLDGRTNAITSGIPSDAHQAAPPDTHSAIPSGISSGSSSETYRAANKPFPPLYRQEASEDSARYNPSYFTRMPARRLPKKSKQPDEQPIPKPQQSVWQRIAYIDEEHIIIRRKDKSLTPSVAALIILGAAQMLKNMPKLSALELSRSLKLSGYLKENERLDRILAAEIKAGNLVYEGSKRNRGYMLTQSGTAKAYTSAERVLING